ncbi:hypothetical protein O181_011976 [Austropuccinia psidii MF-1]|uniref:Uncharacterized protein n=1 Tax=Austropuccinia psidii MF-1 TaxID=1389203 RepID=A0A9Q3BTS0_9BASI|nr:hypothetical protein [Austropuccinia psidii MF-1]
MKELQTIKQCGFLLALCFLSSSHLCMVPNHLQELSSWHEVAVGDGTPRSLNGVQAHFPPGGSQLCESSSIETLGSIATKKGKKRPELESDTRISFDNQRHELPKKPRTEGASELHKEVPNPKPLSPGDDSHRSSITPELMAPPTPQAEWEAWQNSQELFETTAFAADRLKSSEVSELNHSKKVFLFNARLLNLQTPSLFSPSEENRLTSEEDIAMILLSLKTFRPSELMEWGEKMSRCCISTSKNSVSVLQVHTSGTGTQELKDVWIPQLKKDLGSEIKQKPKNYHEDLVVDHFLKLNRISLGKRGDTQRFDKDLLYAFISTLPLGKRSPENLYAKVGHPLNSVIKASLQNFGGFESVDERILNAIKALRDHMMFLNSWTLKIMKGKENFSLFQAEERAFEHTFNYLFFSDQVKHAVLNSYEEDHEESHTLRRIRKLIRSTLEENNDFPKFEFRGKGRPTCVSEIEIMRTEISLNFLKSHYQKLNSVKWEATFRDDEGYLSLMVTLASLLRSQTHLTCFTSLKKLQAFLPWKAELTKTQAKFASARIHFWLKLPTDKIVQEAGSWLITRRKQKT